LTKHGSSERISVGAGASAVVRGAVVSAVVRGAVVSAVVRGGGLKRRTGERLRAAIRFEVLA
jgi:hypothetical protein